MRRIEYCEEHERPQFRNFPWCLLSEEQFVSPCRMVSMRLIPDNEETVERVRAAVGNTDHWDFDSGFGCWTEPSVDAITQAVLAALDGETP